MQPCYDFEGIKEQTPRPNPSDFEADWVFKRDNNQFDFLTLSSVFVWNLKGPWIQKSVQCNGTSSVDWASLAGKRDGSGRKRSDWEEI